MRSVFSYNKDYYGGALMIFIGLAAVTLTEACCILTR